MNVGIVGLGYVGLTLSIVAAMKNCKVYGLEKNEKIRKLLSNKKSHFYEPGLDEMLATQIENNLYVVDQFQCGDLISVYIITVGTPLIPGTNKPNYDYIKSALETLRNNYDGSQLVILRSTISVGTTRSVVLPFLSKMSGIEESKLLVAFCPERTIEGKAVIELQELPQIIGGNNDQSVIEAEKFFRCITSSIVVVGSLESAELIKLFNNTYRDIHFAIGNVFCNIAQSFNVDGVELIKAANLGYKRSNIPMPGFVGGPCLEKDPYILTDSMPDSPGKQFVLSARKFNESLEDKVVNWVVKYTKQHNINSQLCISGIAFKGVPDTSDIRGSNAINICKKLRNLGYDLTLHDFVANGVEVEPLNFGLFYSDIYQAVKGCGLLLILNNNRRYVDLNINQLLNNTPDNFAIFDAWDTTGIVSYGATRNIYTLGSMDLLK